MSAPDSEPDTETSEESVADNEDQTMAKGRRKPKTLLLPEASRGIPEDGTRKTPPTSPPKLPVETSAVPFGSLDDEDNHNMARGNKKSQPTSDVLVPILESSPSIAYPISSPKTASEVSALSVELLDKASHDPAKGKGNIDVATAISRPASLDNHSTVSLTSSAQTLSDFVADSIEPLDEINIAMAEGEKDIVDASARSAADSQDQTSSSLSVISPKMIVEDQPVPTPTASRGGTKATTTNGKSATLAQPKDDSPELVEEYDASKPHNHLGIGAVNLGDLTITEPGERTSARDMTQDNLAADLATSTKSQKAPKIKKKNKLATPNLASSLPASTVIALTRSNTTASTTYSMKTPTLSGTNASRNPSVTAPLASSMAAPLASSMTARTISSMAALANLRSPASTSSSITPPANSVRKFNLVLKSRFGFDEYRDTLKCRKHECGKLTDCYDGSTVICPRCGVNCFFRYCSLECLLHPDMAFHWAQECGEYPIGEESLRLVDKSTLIIRPSGMRPFIECEAHDNPARHRQAVYHSSNGAVGDYFVFNDNSLRPAGASGHFDAICTGHVIAVVSIPMDHGVYEGHSVFQELLEDCLRRGYKRPDRCLALVDFIMKHLVISHQWTQEVRDCLVFQMFSEFAYQIPNEMLIARSTQSVRPRHSWRNSECRMVD